MAGNFRVSLISRILDFQVSREIVGIAFRGFHAPYLKVTKMKAIWSFATKVQQCKKGVNFSWIFVGGSLLSQDLIIRDQ